MSPSAPTCPAAWIPAPWCRLPGGVPRIQTFTTGFEMEFVFDGLEADFDERRAAELMAYTYKTEHYEQVIKCGRMGWSLPRGDLAP